MRKILFRAKTVDDSRWKYGDLITVKRENLCGIKENSVLGIKHLCKSGTIGQYTGMKDINGKKIFEGDILKNEPGTIYGGSYNFEVEYINGMFQGISNCVELEPLYFSECEIIGNVFDNPEAIKGV